MAEMQGADRVVLEKLCHSAQLPHEVVELYEKARVGWERIQGGPMPSDALLMIVLQCDAIYVPEIIPNRLRDVERGTSVYWSSGSTNYTGTFSHVCQEPMDDQVIVFAFGDPELARQVRAVDVETEAEMTARLEQDAVDLPGERKTAVILDDGKRTTAKKKPKKKLVAEEVVPDVDEVVESPVEIALRKEWAGTEAGTKLHVAEPNQPLADAEFVKLNPDDTLEVTINGQARSVSPVDVMRA